MRKGEGVKGGMRGWRCDGEGEVVNVRVNVRVIRYRCESGGRVKVDGGEREMGTKWGDILDGSCNCMYKIHAKTLISGYCVEIFPSGETLASVFCVTGFQTSHVRCDTWFHKELPLC